MELKIFGAPILKVEKILIIKFQDMPYRYYDGVKDNEAYMILPLDYCMIAAMNGQPRADRMREFMKRAEKPIIEALLKAIPLDLDLHKADDKVLSDVWDALKELFEKLEGKGARTAVVTKVLHRKRPRLIPMLDNKVLNNCIYHAWKDLKSDNKTTIPYIWHGQKYNICNCMRLMRDDISPQVKPLRTIRDILIHNKKLDIDRSITLLRLYEAVMWKIYYYNVWRQHSKKSKR